MVSLKGIKNPLPYKYQRIFVGIVYCFLIAGACFTIGTNTTLLRGAHETLRAVQKHPQRSAGPISENSDGSRIGGTQPGSGKRIVR